ncbi:hypothetical protein GOP47_0020649 [Adiantum capillus-veneris]|uniref:MLO-like protein n=1 Tax=Adiantum capillus-veneris TaxID=13818 RepID=A0A9D4U9I9_ADICA|nr:hypothetical protein GOP47_0020649 [Adiantum capillus-veneris]
MAEEQSLLYTPTWAISATCGVFILSSLFAERAVYFIGQILVNYKLKALQAAFEKVKEELMMAGFISLALTLGQNSFSKICVPTKLTATMLLCNKPTNGTTDEETMTQTESAPAVHSSICKEGYSPFMPLENLHQLHILIFLLVTTHIVCSLIIVALGMWSVSQWKAWESRAHIKAELSVHDGVRLTRETTFMRAHALNKWKTNTFMSYVVAFFQQFHNVVRETDYHTLRYGFIMSHMPNNASFNFHKYIRRSFQDDYKYVVGIRPGLWVYSLIWWLLNVDGWESHIIFTAVPLILVLAIGTKLQHIITKMAIQFKETNPLTVGIPNVEPNNKLFWFNRPQFILLCIHFILFQNALEISFDVWTAITFPPDNCLYRQPSLLIGRITIGIVVQMLCGLITLPDYALVSQMGSNVKKAIFEEHIRTAVRKWHKRAKARIRTAQDSGEGSSSRSSHTRQAIEDDPSQEDAGPIEMVVSSL